VLSEKPWKLEGIVRLLLSIFICICTGPLVAAALFYSGPGGKTRIKFALLALAAFVFLALTLVLLQKRWTLANLARWVAVSLVCFYAGILLAFWAEQTAETGHGGTKIGQMIVGMLSFQAAALVLVGLFLRQQHMSWAEGFGYSNHWQRAALVGVISICLFLPVGRVLQKVSIQVMEHFPIKPEEQQAVQTLRLASSWIDRLVLGIATIVLAPVAEETLFRGIIYPAIKQAGFPKAALWVTSLLFAVIHIQNLGNLPTFLPLLLLAIILTFLYEKTHNLLAPIAAHSVFNAVNFAALYLAEQQMS
jgi:membrane protease YdiL (CAAX protease family)